MAVTSAVVEPRAVRARAAVSAVFFVNAVLYANLVPRLPDVKDALDLSNAALGTAIAAMPVGALLAGLGAPAVIQRLGSARVAAFGLLALAVGVVGVPLSGSWAVLAAKQDDESKRGRGVVSRRGTATATASSASASA